MHEIDRSFRAKRAEAEEKRVRTVRRRVVAAALGTVAIGLGGAVFLAVQQWVPISLTPPVTKTDAPADAPPKQQKPVYVNPIIDLAGDPLIIRVGDSAADSKLREVAVTPELKLPTLPDDVEILSDIMLSSSERIMALPSSPEDFAFFQSQSARGKSSINVQPAADEPGVAEPLPDEPEDSGPDAEEILVPVGGQDDLEEGSEELALEEEELSVVEDGIQLEDLTSGEQQQTGEIGEPNADLGAGWGETVTEGQEELPAFKKTAIADTMTVHLVKPEPDRIRQIEDFTVSVKGDRPLESIVAEYGFGADDGKNAGEAAKRLFGLETLGERFVVGLRGWRPGGKGARRRLVQISINSPDKYLGTLALADDGTFVAGADPWINDDLSQYADSQPQVQQPQSYRLLDAIYSTATRNNVPSSVTGEAIMLVSRAFDLQALATKDDRLVLAFAKTGRDEGEESGRVLYVAIHGVDRNFECFVYQPQPGAEFACMSEKDETHSVTVTNGMVTPVQGVLTSTFGPRRHPILKQVRIHKGVDWAAPIGTPIMAAFDGTVEFAGDGKGYGNVIRISHGAGKATAYAHMSRFENGMAAGIKVTAGQVIGYIGTTGLSTGPHLHFELYESGVAVDPLGSAVAEALPESAAAAGSDGSAVELLVNRIIRVESGGNARAKNPLSSATGLGQFIKSTWLRMIRTYRPDLFKSMSEADILALRYDPTISREMVANLARENEARLRANGHSITAGRLYLAHFLGPEGAHQALAAPSNALVAEVLGAQVISANPFLTGKDCAYVIAWAEKKMTGKAVRYSSQSSVTTKTVVRTSTEFIAYRETMLKLVEMAAASGGTAPLGSNPAAATPETQPDETQPDAGGEPDSGDL